MSNAELIAYCIIGGSGLGAGIWLLEQFIGEYRSKRKDKNEPKR